MAEGYLEKVGLLLDLQVDKQKALSNLRKTENEMQNSVKPLKQDVQIEFNRKGLSKMHTQLGEIAGDFSQLAQKALITVDTATAQEKLREYQNAVDEAKAGYMALYNGIRNNKLKGDVGGLDKLQSNAENLLKNSEKLKEFKSFGLNDAMDDYIKKIGIAGKDQQEEAKKSLTQVSHLREAFAYLTKEQDRLYGKRDPGSLEKYIQTTRTLEEIQSKIIEQQNKLKSLGGKNLESILPEGFGEFHIDERKLNQSMEHLFKNYLQRAGYVSISIDKILTSLRTKFQNEIIQLADKQTRAFRSKEPVIDLTEEEQQIEELEKKYRYYIKFRQDAETILQEIEKTRSSKGNHGVKADPTSQRNFVGYASYLKEMKELGYTDIDIPDDLKNDLEYILNSDDKYKRVANGVHEMAEAFEELRKAQSQGNGNGFGDGTGIDQESIDRITDGMNDLSEKMEVLDDKVTGVSEKLDKLDDSESLNHVIDKVNDLSDAVTTLDGKLDTVSDKLQNGFEPRTDNTVEGIRAEVKAEEDLADTIEEVAEAQTKVAGDKLSGRFFHGTKYAWEGDKYDLGKAKPAAAGSGMYMTSDAEKVSNWARSQVKEVDIELDKCFIIAKDYISSIEDAYKAMNQEVKPDVTPAQLMSDIRTFAKHSQENSDLFRSNMMSMGYQGLYIDDFINNRQVKDELVIYDESKLAKLQSFTKNEFQELKHTGSVTIEIDTGSVDTAIAKVEDLVEAERKVSSPATSDESPISSGQNANENAVSSPENVENLQREATATAEVREETEKLAQAKKEENSIPLVEESSGQMAMFDGLVESQQKVQEEIKETNEQIDGQISLLEYLANQKVDNSTLSSSATSTASEVSKEGQEAKETSEKMEELAVAKEKATEANRELASSARDTVGDVNKEALAVVEAAEEFKEYQSATQHAFNSSGLSGIKDKYSDSGYSYQKATLTGYAKDTNEATISVKYFNEELKKTIQDTYKLNTVTGQLSDIQKSTWTDDASARAKARQKQIADNTKANEQAIKQEERIAKLREDAQKRAISNAEKTKTADTNASEKALIAQSQAYQRILEIRGKISQLDTDNDSASIRQLELQLKDQQEIYLTNERVIKQHRDIISVKDQELARDKARERAEANIAAEIERQNKSKSKANESKVSKPEISAELKSQISNIEKGLKLGNKPLTADFQNEVNDAIIKLNDVKTVIEQINKNPIEFMTDENLAKINQGSDLVDDINSKVGKSTQAANKDAINNLINGVGKMQQMTELPKEVMDRVNDLMYRLQNGSIESAADVDKLKSEFLALRGEVQATGKTGKSFFDMFTSRVKSMSASALAMYFSFYDIIRYARELADTVKEVNSAQIELRKVSEASDKQLTSYWSHATESAKEYGATITEVINSAADWSRLGYSIEDAEKLADATTLLLRVGDNMTQESSSEGLISTLKGFGKVADEAEHIVDVANEVANTEPIDTAGLFEGLQKSASSLDAANNSLEQSIALITTARLLLAEKYGNIFLRKYLIARITLEPCTTI